MRSFYRKVHFTGIGGAGMSSIASVLLSRGCAITGSDKQLNEFTAALAVRGAEIHLGHDAANITDQDVVVYTSAADPANPEIQAALVKGIPVVKRSVMLAECMRYCYGIGVSGTHGKSTTTTMLGLVLDEAGLDPTVIVGARSKAFGGSNARIGNGDFIAVEADEYDRTFLELAPVITITTNIEAEHLDIYRDLDDIKDAFVAFSNKVPFYGFCVLCADDAGVRSILPRVTAKTITYGTDEDACFRASDITYQPQSSSCTVQHNGNVLGTLTVPAAGRHNVLNALAAVAVAVQLTIPFEVAAAGIARFSGVERRLQVLYDNGLTVIDDYAHHPTEVAASLNAIKHSWQKPVIAVFQPHLYSRTRDFYNEFAVALSSADVVICLDVYPARELPVPGVSGKLITDALTAAGKKQVVYAPAISDALQHVELLAIGDCVVVTMGAGDVNKVGIQFLQLKGGQDV